jgi:queuine tRNA-ribosyltransferase
MIKNAKDFKFEIISKDKKSKARVGEITTAHGIIQTPSFVPVGTKASVRSLSPQDLKETKTQILFGNTYHLYLQPGEDIIKDFGGLARFMAWDGPARNATHSVAGGPTITDSGGFQVFSLGKIGGPIRSFPSASAPLSVRAVGSPSSSATLDSPKLVKITDDGVEFRSHIDGSKHMFTPEKSIEIQRKLGADLIVTFDECAPNPSTYEYTKKAMIKTHNWAIRCLDAFDKNKPYYSWGQALYGIIQGGLFKDLREESAKFISNLPFDGICIGGVAVGEGKKEMRDAVDWTLPFLPEEKPRHLLGIGEVDDIFAAIERGMDTFDCVIPTRFGRYGIVFTGKPEGNIKNKFRIDIRKSKYAKDKGPLVKDCGCKVCKTYTRGYINHLLKANELLAYNLASHHNVYFINNLVSQIRQSILDGNFQEIKKEWLM